MANAKKCDRCGSFYDQYSNVTSVMDVDTVRSMNGVSFININTENVYTTKFTYDLCPSCLDSLIEFMNIRKKYSNLTDEEYYWEKAEFQDEYAHKRHVDNYRLGIRDSIVFDKEYAEEAGLID